MYYKYSKHRKHIILIILCLSLFMLLKIYSTKTKKYDADTFCFVFAQKDELCFNENMFFYDMNKNIYYFPIDKQYENDKFYYKIKNKDNLKKYTINSMQINTEEYSVSYNDEFHYQVFDNESVVKDITFMFTNLPIINVLLNNEINDQEQNAKFNIINLYGRDNNMISEEDITIRLRGQTSRHFPKKSYRIEFDDFKEKNISLSSFYISENKDWALDALYTDVSKIRNKLGNEMELY